MSDSAVAGVAYQSSPSGKSGTTNQYGEYDYVEGDTVTFTVAGLVLPPVTAKGRITPQTIAEEAFPESEHAALNLAILLQGLDSDGDPSNGITVDGTTTLPHSISTSLTDDTPQTFAGTLSAQSLPVGASVPDPVQALEHFYRTELSGNWRLGSMEGGSASGDIFVSFDAFGHAVWVEYDVDGSPSSCSSFSEGYSAVYTGAMAVEPTSLVVTMESNERDLGTGCAPGSTDHVADMFGAEIVLQGEQLVMTHPEETVTVYFDRMANVKHAPQGAWVEAVDTGIVGGGAEPLSFGEQMDSLLLSLFTDEHWVHVVLDRAPEGTSCEHNGVYVAPYTFAEVEGSREISMGTHILNHIWSNPSTCDKELPSGELWSYLTSRANDSEWNYSIASKIYRNLSAAERDGEFNASIVPEDLIGSWHMDDASDDDVDLHILNFLNDGKYVQGVIHLDDGSGDPCGNGLEYGPYQLAEGVLTFESPDNETLPNTGCGMTEDSVPSVFTAARIAGNKLVLAEGEGWEQLSFTRVKNDGLRGTWALTQSEYVGDGTVLTLLDDGRYLQMQPLEDLDDDPDSWDGTEYGRYTLSEAGSLKVTEILSDLNGHSGLSDGLNESIQLNVDEEGFLRMDNDDGCFGFQRVEDALSSVAELGDCPEDFSSLTPGSYSSHAEGDEHAGIFELYEGGNGTWSYGETEGGLITWEVADGVLVMTFDGSGTEYYTLVSGSAYDGTVNIDFSDETSATATWISVAP